MEGDVGAGCDGEAEGAAVVGDLTGVDVEAVERHFLARAVDVDAGLDRVGAAKLAALLLDHRVVGDGDVHEALAGALAVETDPVGEPFGVAPGPGEHGRQVTLAPHRPDRPVDGEVQHHGCEPAARPAARPAEGVAVCDADPRRRTVAGLLGVADLALVVVGAGLDAGDEPGGY